MPAGRTEDVSWEESLRDSRGATTPQHGKGIHASDLEWRASGGAHQQTNRHHHRSQSAGPGKPLRSGDVSNRRAGASSGGAGSGSYRHGGSSNLPQKTPRAAANEAIQRAPTETLLRWVRSNGVSVTTLDELKDGVGLCDIIRRLEPTAPLTGLNRKAKSRAAIVTNLELALQATWRKTPPTKIMPTAERILADDSSHAALTGLLLAMVEVFVVRPLCRHDKEANAWFSRVLRPYSIPIPPGIHVPPLGARGDAASILWQEGEGCTDIGLALFCIAHSCSPHTARPLPDPACIYLLPEESSEANSNLAYSLECLENIGVPPVLCEGDAITPPVRLLLLAQLYSIWARLGQRDGQYAGGLECCAGALVFADHQRLLEREAELRAAVQGVVDDEQDQKWRHNAELARAAALHAAERRREEDVSVYDDSRLDLSTSIQASKPGAWL